MAPNFSASRLLRTLTTFATFATTSPRKLVLLPRPQLTLQISLATKKQRSEPMMAGKGEKQFWLLKTEPGEWSWEDQAASGGLSNWDGVKNKQAQKNLKSMRLGDLCFFYHSGAHSRRVVGVVTVVKEWYEATAGEGVVVDVKAVGEMRRPVDLKEMKGDDGLKGFVLFRQPRLSVVPVPAEIWERVCELGGGFEGDGKVDGDDSGEED